MSWVFAAISHNPITREIKNKFKVIHHYPQYLQESAYIYIASAGPDLTTCCHLNYHEDNSGYIILGSPLWAIENGYHFLTKNDWDHFSWEDDDICRLEGHYALLRWHGNHFECWTDPIGLRDFLIVNTVWGYVITTRLDWASRMIDASSFNLEALSTHIIVGATLGEDMIINGIRRVYRGMKAEITAISCIIQQMPCSEIKPSIHTRDELNSDMMKRVLLPFKENRRLSMALSGGLDSRTVLSYLLLPEAKHYRSLWDAYTIGSAGESDLKIAKRISNEFHIKHKIIEPDLAPVSELWNYMKENVLSMRMDMFPSITNRYQFMFDMAKYYDGIIDGGSGWLLKYQVSRKTGFKHRNDIITGNWDNIVPDLMRNDAFFFSNEAREQMTSKIHTRTIELMSRIESPNTLGFYNWLNQFFIDSHLPFKYSSHQIWVDNILQDYMPTMSHIFMKNILQIPTEQKIDNRLCYYFIRKNKEKLIHIPRVAYGLQLPCRTNTLYFATYAKIHHKLFPVQPQHSNMRLWNHLREPVLDQLNSNTVRQYERYDWMNLRNHVESFYQGKTENANWIDHWLRFDFWRELVEGK